MDFGSTVITEDQSLNGIKVLVHRHYNSKGQVTGSVVEADCNCFGYNGRAHSTTQCPRFQAAKKSRYRFTF